MLTVDAAYDSGLHWRRESGRKPGSSRTPECHRPMAARGTRHEAPRQAGRQGEAPGQELLDNIVRQGAGGRGEVSQQGAARAAGKECACRIRQRPGTSKAPTCTLGRVKRSAFFMQPTPTVLTSLGGETRHCRQGARLAGPARPGPAAPLPRPRRRGCRVYGLGFR
jgi:hypothetical protein